MENLEVWKSKKNFTDIFPTFLITKQIESKKSFHNAEIWKYKTQKLKTPILEFILIFIDTKIRFSDERL